MWSTDRGRPTAESAKFETEKESAKLAGTKSVWMSECNSNIYNNKNYEYVGQCACHALFVNNHLLNDNVKRQLTKKNVMIVELYAVP